MSDVITILVIKNFLAFFLVLTRELNPKPQI